MNAYKNAGVDVTAGYESNELIKKHVESTKIAGVMGGIGGFGGLFDLSKYNKKEPVLVSGTDGVGTKLKLAFLMDKHDTIGQDCVAMCVNDIVCSGAKPLFFLDYLAMGKNYPNRTEQIVKGVANGCKLAECALVGGETAEMPGFYPDDEYDLAGFSVGIAEKSEMLSPDKVQKGNTLVAIKSSGVHSNGFSLVRKLFDLNNDTANDRISQYSDELGMTVGESLLTPTRIYVKETLELLGPAGITSISHITGGGFYENLPRMLPGNLTAQIDYAKIQILPIFKLMSKIGGIDEKEMFGIFNMGVGMVVACSNPQAILDKLGDDAYIIGEVAEA